MSLRSPRLEAKREGTARTRRRRKGKTRARKIHSYSQSRDERRTKSPVAAQYLLAPPISNSTVPFLPFRRRPSSAAAAAASAAGSADLAAAPHAPSPPATNPGRVAARVPGPDADRDGPKASPTKSGVSDGASSPDAKPHLATLENEAPRGPAALRAASLAAAISAAKAASSFSANVLARASASVGLRLR